MNSLSDTFPYRDLTAAEVKNYRFMAGTPKPSRQLVTSLLEGGNQPLKSNIRMLRLMNATMVNSITELGSEYKTGSRLYLGGALLFGSVYQFFSGDNTLPVDEAAIEEIEQTECRDFMFDGPSRLKATAGNFHELLDYILPVLDAGDEPVELAYIGASVIQASLRAPVPHSPAIPEQLQQYEADDSLADLNELFRRELG